MIDNKKIYYWANNTENNSGEGILANNFLNLLKKRNKKLKLIKLNNFKRRENFYYNYIFPFFGLIKIWKYHLQKKSTCYINYLPIWNFLFIILLPKKTILGPITGTNTKKNFFYILLKTIGIYVLKRKREKILFSHDQFSNYFIKKNNIFYNFLLFNFKFKYKKKTKIYDFVFYYRKNNNKGNEYLLNIIHKLSAKYKIAIIGEKIKISKKNKNIKNYLNLSRKKTINIISKSSFSLSSKENLLSYFTIDCLSQNLIIFYNKELSLNKSIKTNMLIPINFKNLKLSIKIIEREIKSKKLRKYFKFSTKNFINYLN